MPTIGVLEGYDTSRPRRSAPVLLGRVGLTPAAPVRSLRRIQPNFLRGDDPGALSVTASIGAGAGRAMDAIWKNARNAALAAGKTSAEADAAAQMAVNAYKGTIISNAQARTAQEAAEHEAARLREIVNHPNSYSPESAGARAMADASKAAEHRAGYLIVAREINPPQPMPIDDRQGVYPQGDRGGSGSIPGPGSYRDSPTPKEVPLPIDTRGNSTETYTDMTAPAGAGTGGSRLLFPILAAATYFLMK